MKDRRLQLRWRSGLVLAVLVASCVPAADSGAIRITDATTRPGEVGGTVGIYFTMTNPGDAADRLLGGESPAAQSVELHETMMEGDVVHMMPIPGIDLPAGATVKLQPGGMHIMLVGLVEALEVGDRVPLNLRFDRAGSIAVEVEVVEP